MGSWGTPSAPHEGNQQAIFTHNNGVQIEVKVSAMGMPSADEETAWLAAVDAVAALPDFTTTYATKEIGSVQSYTP